MPISLLLAAASITLYTGPRPEEVVVYKDWVTGCDNVRNCSAIALQAKPKNADDNIDHLEILIDRPLPTHLHPTVKIKIPSGTENPSGLMLFIDDRAIDLPSPSGQHFIFTGPDALALIRKLRAGTWAHLRQVEDQDFARASLAGLTASLLRMDEQQGRSGTAKALAKPGTRVPYDDLPGYQVSLARPARPDRPPSEIQAKAMADLQAKDQCAVDVERLAAPPKLIRLDSDKSMIIMPWQCGNGAYNLYSNIMIVNGFGEVSAATFDYDNGITGDGPSNVLVNVSWDDEKRVLEGFARHRGIGDCGRVDRYIWGGEKFMLSEQLLMPECRMAFDRIRTWKVDVADR
jgi:hypothetical protein